MKIDDAKDMVLARKLAGKYCLSGKARSRFLRMVHMFHQPGDAADLEFTLMYDHACQDFGQEVGSKIRKAFEEYRRA